MMTSAAIKKMPLDDKILLIQRLLTSIADDEIGYECNPRLCDWLSELAIKIEERLD